MEMFFFRLLFRADTQLRAILRAHIMATVDIGFLREGGRISLSSKCCEAFLSVDNSQNPSTDLGMIFKNSISDLVDMRASRSSCVRNVEEGL